MYTIVAGIDDSEARAEAQAETIIEMPFPNDEVEVVLVHDFDENRSGASVAQVAAVERAEELLGEQSITVKMDESGAGDPASTILAFAEQYDADLISLAGRKRSPTGKVLFGSTAQEVILNTTYPVLVCSPDGM